MHRTYPRPFHRRYPPSASLSRGWGPECVPAGTQGDQGHRTRETAPCPSPPDVPPDLGYPSLPPLASGPLSSALRGSSCHTQAAVALGPGAGLCCRSSLLRVRSPLPAPPCRSPEQLQIPARTVSEVWARRSPPATAAPLASAGAYLPVPGPTAPRRPRSRAAPGPSTSSQPAASPRGQQPALGAGGAQRAAPQPRAGRRGEAGRARSAPEGAQLQRPQRTRSKARHGRPGALRIYPRDAMRAGAVGVRWSRPAAGPALGLCLASAKTMISGQV